MYMSFGDDTPPPSKFTAYVALINWKNSIALINFLKKN